MDGPEARGFWSVEKRPHQCADTRIPSRGRTVVPRHRRERRGDGSRAVSGPGQGRASHCLCQQVTRGEQRYCTARKELLAVVRALKHFKCYLYGQKITVRTDNSAVSWLHRSKDPVGQPARWIEVIDTYDITFQHRPGRKHGNADALSRYPCRQCGGHSDLIRTRGTKLQFPWFGPALITKVLDRGRVVVRRKRDKPLAVMHVDRLETYQGTAVPAWMTTEQRECVAV